MPQNFTEALAAEVSSQFCARVFRGHNKNKGHAADQRGPFPISIYCAGALGAAGALGVAGVLAVTSVAGVIFTVARIFSSR
jgi:hypothetical protein